MVLLTVEYDREGERVEIHFDEVGAGLLAGRISALARRDERNHDHLITPSSWAGWELTEQN